MAIGLDDALVGWLVASAGDGFVRRLRGDPVKAAMRAVIEEAITATVDQVAGGLDDGRAEHLRASLLVHDGGVGDEPVRVTNEAELRDALHAWTAALDHPEFGEPGYLTGLSLDPGPLADALTSRIVAGIRRNGRRGGPLNALAEWLWRDELSSDVREIKRDLSQLRSAVGDVSARSIQAGPVEGGIHHHYALRPAVTFPFRAGIMPPRAASFQRREVSCLLSRLLSEEAAGQHVRTVVVSGLGGAGKTQVAVDYAERLWDAGEVDLLVWITAGSRAEVVSSYSRLAVDVTGIEDADPGVGARRLLAWLASTSVRWLIVLDDVRSPGEMRGLWPPVTSAGRVVVTTRRRDAAFRGDRRRLIDVDVFTETEARQYLRATVADRGDLLDGVAELAHELGYLPLALAQAAAYMLDRHLSCAQYLLRWADRRRKLASLIPEGDALPDEHRSTVATTWSLSIEQANTLEPAGLASPLLELAGLLDPNGVPAAVFTAPPVTDWLTARTGHLVSAEQAHDGLGCLHRLSLITLNPGSSYRTVRAHALVQRATRDTMSIRQLRAAARVAADALARVWPDIERDTTLSQVLRANTDALTQVGGEHLWRPGVHVVAVRAGLSLDAAGSAAEARDYFERLLATAHDRLGPDHPDTLNIRGNLAGARGKAGDLVGAIIAYEELLKGQRRRLGDGHPDTLASRSNLAFFRGEVGDLAKAISEYETLLTDMLGLLGPDHPDTLAVRNNLARARSAAGDYAGAVGAYRALLADLVRMRGPDHPYTLTTRSNLIRCHGISGDPARAATMAQELLADQQRVLGPDHPYTLTTRSTLARWRGMAGDPAGAVAVNEELLADRQRVLGPDHPDTLMTRSNLALWRGMAGDPAGAVAACKELLTDQLRVLGPDHPEIQNTRSMLANWRKSELDNGP